MPTAALRSFCRALLRPETFDKGRFRCLAISAVARTECSSEWLCRGGHGAAGEGGGLHAKDSDG